MPRPALTLVSSPVQRPVIYTAGKIRHRDRFLRHRGDGLNIVASWLDAPDNLTPEQSRTLAIKCIGEAARCDVLILYAEPGDDLRCTLAEVGAALAGHATVFQVGTCALLEPDESSDCLFRHHPRFRQSMTIEDAVALWEHCNRREAS